MIWNGIELPEKNIYFKDDDSLIYCADCREILPLIPEKSIDLVLTDPPYGIDYQSARRTAPFRKDKIAGDKDYPLWVFNYKPRRATFAWCRWDILLQLPPP